MLLDVGEKVVDLELILVGPKWLSSCMIKCLLAAAYAVGNAGAASTEKAAMPMDGSCQTEEDVLTLGSFFACLRGISHKSQFFTDSIISRCKPTSMVDPPLKHLVLALRAKDGRESVT